MSYVNLFTQLAVQAEESASKIASELRSDQQAEQVLDELETAWNDAAEDGVIDSNEMSRLRALVNEAGLGKLAERLQSSHLEGDALENVEALLTKESSAARREITRGNDLKRIDLHLALDTLKSYYQGASDALRREGQMYDAVVQNLRA